MKPYLNPQLSAEERVRDLLDRMNPEEKIGQLCKCRGFDNYTRQGNEITVSESFAAQMKHRPVGTVYGVFRADWWTKRDFENGITPEIAAKSRNAFQRLAVEESRLGIPLLFAEEAPHGLMALGGTHFPTGLGLGASFDAELLYKIGLCIGEEAAARGVASVYAPILDLALDPRWSRVEECFSESVYSVMELSAAMTAGLRDAGVEPTLKHYVGGGHAEGGHNMQSAHIGPYELRNSDLRPFRRCIVAGAKMLMATYHDVDGEPCAGSRYLLDDILRGELGFDGFVTADAGAVELLYHTRNARDIPHAAARALQAGCDGESGHPTLDGCGKALIEALEAGLITGTDLDKATGRILKIKFELGLFEHPYLSENTELSPGLSLHRELAREAAEKSLILLKNDAGFLPLTNIRRLAVIGPNADHAANMLGDYSASLRPEDVTTLLVGIRKLAALRGIEVTCTRGCGIRSKDTSGFARAIELALEADCVIFVPGGSSTRYGETQIDPVTGAVLPPAVLNDDCSEKESGEGTDRATLDFCGVQLELFRKLAATGTPVVTVPVLGRPLLMEELLRGSAAVLCAWYPGMEGGTAVAGALFGEFSPGGRLPVSLPRNIGQLPVFAENRSERPSYLDSPGSALLSFGFGLSYTAFAYSDLQIIGKQKVRVTVKNTGSMAGDETVLFYLQQCNAPQLRPEWELCGFRRLHLLPGESAAVEIKLDPESLGRYDRNGRFQPGTGEFRIRAGELQTLFAL